MTTASEQLAGPLLGPVVELIPLEAAHACELADAAAIDRATFGFTEVPDGDDAMRVYIDKHLRAAEGGLTIPYAQRLAATGRLVGCTRFIDPQFWSGRDAPDEVEIGGTWLSADVQRSPVNTASKLLLLTHAFDTWSVRRVALATDERNALSRAAIERIGGRLEGILRNHRPSTHPGERGEPRNTAVFSITDDEWPSVRERLERRLGGL